MRCVKSIFTVSIFAMLIATGARAEIVSKTQLDSTIVAGTNVTIEKPTSGTNSGKIVISATDTNTTYTTGTETYSGTTKLYTATGDSTDGTMTRGAITTALNGKEDVVNKVTNASSYTDDVTSTDKYPSMAVANDMVKQGVKSVTDKKLDERFEYSPNEVMVTDAEGIVGPSEIKTDGSGNAVTGIEVKNGVYTLNKGTTFATKAQLDALDSTSTGTGAVVTNVTQTDGKVTVTKGNVQVPVGSSTATTYAAIWIE